MVNGRFFPTIRRVALVANYSQTALMGIVLTVTAGAVDWCPPEDTIHVAVMAIDYLMLAHQGKSGQIVVDGDLLPGLGRVALVAQLAQTAFMGIIPAVTAGTINRCPPEETIQMAVLAVNLLVTAHELKGKQVMLDADLLPIIR